MSKFPRSAWCKAAAVVLVGLLAFQSEFLLSQGAGPMAERLAAARASYAAGDFEGAREVLEAMLPALEETGAADDQKGEAYLFLGAALEKLQEKQLAVENFCRAKTLLGEGKGAAGLELAGLTYYAEPCPPPLTPVAAVVVADPLAARFAEARETYFAGEYEAAKEILEKLVAELAAVRGRDTFKGEVYLLTGAAYEKLKFKALAFKYYCLAKDILGEGKTIEGLKLKDLAYYAQDCRQPQTYAKIPRHGRGGGGKFLGSLLGLAALAVGGYFLYTKVLKKKDGGGGGGGGGNYDSDYQAWSCWSAEANSGSSTLPTIAPANGWNPNPNRPQITSWRITLSVTACKGLTRRDIVWVNDVQRLDVTNRFDRACGGDIASFCNNPTDGKTYDVASGSGEAALKLRHQIVFTTPTGAPVRVISQASFEGR
jgi:tetratricopeptide (TPR) repeat protein